MAPSNVAIDVRARARTRLALQAFAATLTLSVFAVVVQLPVLSLSLIGAAGLLSLIFGAQSTRDPLETVASFEARETLRAIQIAQQDIDNALQLGPGPAMLASIAERCRAVVKLSVRMAILGNPLHNYMASHDPSQLRYDLERLRTRIELTRDPDANRSLARAAAARDRQLSTYEDMRQLAARIQAKLELTRAALESFVATLYKLHVVDEAQIVLASQTMSNDLEDVRGDLVDLEAALQLAA